MPLCDAAALAALPSDVDVVAAAKAIDRACTLPSALKSGVRGIAAAGPDFFTDIDQQVASDAGAAWLRACPDAASDGLFGEKDSTVRRLTWAGCPILARYATEQEWATAQGSWSLVPLLAAALEGDGWTLEAARPVVRAIGALGVTSPCDRETHLCTRQVAAPPQK